MGVSGRRWKTASSQSVAILGEGNGDFSPVVAISDEGESAIVSQGNRKHDRGSYQGTTKAYDCSDRNDQKEQTELSSCVTE
ncbi:hypothetical protein Bca101_034789 [Brassica carinata]